MSRKQRRTVLIATSLAILGLATGLVLYALTDKITYFRTPSDIAEKKVTPGQRFRLGGLVTKGSVKRGADAKVEFEITDTLKSQAVSYQGVLPDLFREGQGVVTEGVLNSGGTFIADTVLAKHDENYMPPDVAKSLKDRGVKVGAAAQHTTPVVGRLTPEKPAEPQTGNPY